MEQDLFFCFSSDEECPFFVAEDLIARLGPHLLGRAQHQSQRVVLPKSST